MSTRTVRGPAFVKPRSRLRKWLPVLLLLGAVGCLAGAFLQFRVSQEVRQASIMLVMDASDSMERTDIGRTRLAAAQDAASAFLRELPQDFRVGLVTFDAVATERSAPTEDRAVVQGDIDALGTERGTAIGDGLVTALDSLERDWRTNGRGASAVLLLTDGIDSDSEVLPMVAAERAGLQGVPVYTVLLGRPQVDENGVLNLSLLRQMAEQTGGQSFNAESADELNRVYERLGSTLSTELAVTDIGLPFLIAAGAFGLLAAFALIRGTDATDWR